MLKRKWYGLKFNMFDHVYIKKTWQSTMPHYHPITECEGIIAKIDVAHPDQVMLYILKDDEIVNETGWYNTSIDLELLPPLAPIKVLNMVCVWCGKLIAQARKDVK